MEALEDALGDALGVLYVQKHFQGDAKPRALRIVEQVSLHHPNTPPSYPYPLATSGLIDILPLSPPP